MPVNLSVKNVPDDLAERLRRRAERNRRSLQRELVSILEAAVGQVPASATDQMLPAEREPITIEELGEIARRLFPNGTASSVETIRKMREGH